MSRDTLDYATPNPRLGAMARHLRIALVWLTAGVAVVAALAGVQWALPPRVPPVPVVLIAAMPILLPIAAYRVHRSVRVALLVLGGTLLLSALTLVIAYAWAIAPDAESIRQFEREPRRGHARHDSSGASFAGVLQPRRRRQTPFFSCRR